MAKNKNRDQRSKQPGGNPSPIGTQQNPVSDPHISEKNSVEKEAEASVKAHKELDRKGKKQDL